MTCINTSAFTFPCRRKFKCNLNNFTPIIIISLHLLTVKFDKQELEMTNEDREQKIHVVTYYCN